MALLKLSSVTKIYQRSHLGRVRKSVGITDVNLEIRKGEAFGLLGLNGSGKTTTIKLLLGLLYPTKGVVEVMDKIMPDQEALQKIGYLPEVAYINKYLTGREAIKMFAQLSGVARSSLKSVVNNVIDQVGLQAAADKRVSEYSKGMVQRVSIAQVLLHDPEILILDEPITGLDPLAIREIRELVLWLKSRGKTIFLSSHSISEVERVCDRIGILAGGRMVAQIGSEEWRDKKGRLEEIFTSTVTRSENIGPLRFQDMETVK